MKQSCTADRLRHIMNSRNLRQVDILRMCQPYCAKHGVKMNKSDISQYLSGKAEPSQDKLIVLGMALGVQESWLMGFDVPESRDIDVKKEPAMDDELSAVKMQLVEWIRNMPETEAVGILAALNSNQKSR